MATTPPAPTTARRQGHVILPRLLLARTVATGVVDAVSYLALGHVFVANMTGNVVFLGFAAAGAPGLSVPPSLTAITAFLVGSLAGGILARRVPHRGRLLAVAAACARPTRKIGSVLTMFAGALAGALLVLHVGIAAALVLALVVIASASAAALALSRGTAPEEWVTPAPSAR